MAINLIAKNLEKEKEHLEKRQVFRVGAIGLAVYLVLLIGVGAFFLYIYQEEKNLAGSRDALLAEIKTYQNKEQNLVLLKDRLGTVGKIKGIRPNFLEVLTVLPGVAGNLAIKSVSLTEGELRVAVSSPDTFGLEELIGNIQKSDKLKGAAIENIELTTEGDFQASLSLQIK